MPSFRFLHAADLHLDSPLLGLSRREPDLADLFRDASRKALTNLVDAAIGHEVAFVLIAGDLYDGDWQDYATGQVFLREASRLTRAGIRVFIARGNHDAASRMSRSLPLPDGVREFSTKGVESIALDDIDCVLHGRGFADQAVTENVALSYPMAVPGRLNIGVLHTSLSGRPGHAPYAPCTVEDLLRAGYDYWALGHIHTREVVHERPPVVFPGNLQGRHIRETGAKGATLVEVVDSRITALTALALDAARWQRTEVDLTGCPSQAEAEDAIRRALADTNRLGEGRPTATRVRLTGATSLHAVLLAAGDALREQVQALAHATSDYLLIEKVQVETVPQDAAVPPDPELVESLGFVDRALLADRAAALHAEIIRRMPTSAAPDLSPDIAVRAEALILASLAAGRRDDRWETDDAD